MFSAVFVFQVFRPLKVLQKFHAKYIKNQRNRNFRNHQEREGGPPPGSQEGRCRGPGAALGTLLTTSWVPSIPPFACIYPSGWKPLISIFFSRTPLCTAAAAVSRSGLPGEAAAAPCRKEEPPPGDHP